MALTKEDQDRAIAMFAKGSSALYEMGMDAKSVRNFLHREDVLSYMELLQTETTEHPALMERAKFVAFRRLRGMLDQATRVLEDALNGVKYARNPKTGEILLDAKKRPILMDLPPDDTTVGVAQDVLDRLGVVEKGEYDPTRDGGMNNILAKAKQPVNIQYAEGSAEDQRVIQRETLRLAIERTIERLPDIRRSLSPALDVMKKKTRAKVPATSRVSALKSRLNKGKAL